MGGPHPEVRQDLPCLPLPVRVRTQARPRHRQVDNLRLFNERDEPHWSSAPRADHRVHLAYVLDEARPGVLRGRGSDLFDLLPVFAHQRPVGARIFVIGVGFGSFGGCPPPAVRKAARYGPDAPRSVECPSQVGRRRSARRNGTCAPRDSRWAFVRGLLEGIYVAGRPPTKPQSLLPGYVMTRHLHSPYSPSIPP
jgi:hypothetical protein